MTAAEVLRKWTVHVQLLLPCIRAMNRLSWDTNCGAAVTCLLVGLLTLVHSQCTTDIMSKWCM